MDFVWENVRKWITGNWKRREKVHFRSIWRGFLAPSSFWWPSEGLERAASSEDLSNKLSGKYNRERQRWLLPKRLAFMHKLANKKLTLICFSSCKKGCPELWKFPTIDSNFFFQNWASKSPTEDESTACRRLKGIRRLMDIGHKSIDPQSKLQAIRGFQWVYGNPKKSIRVFQRSNRLQRRWNLHLHSIFACFEELGWWKNDGNLLKVFTSNWSRPKVQNDLWKLCKVQPDLIHFETDWVRHFRATFDE